ncbi:mitochondrial glutamate carrier 1-like [Sitodiplosis mosellana]|uniref:mitochondrial glutamate carrier 1-like n=1 Tax=Sitodiplosis mosellana TaxID=263140 RepID=UPI002443F378|nr:mitochondrial glutamate carrier 1-like [Sitodiplosis mosellana]
MKETAAAVEIKTKRFALLPKVINGGIAGIVGITCVFPLDLVKTRLQNQSVGPNGEKLYKSMLDCFRKTYRADGFLGMYRGSAVTVLFVTPEKAVKLVANDFFRHKFATKNGKLPVTHQMAAGALAGMFQISVTTPMELLKIQLQDTRKQSVKSKTIEKPSATKIALELLRKKGIFGQYKGIGATACRDIFFSIIYFPLFATLNQFGPRKSNRSNDAAFFVSFASGCAAGSLAALSVTPFDVVKTRLQILNRAEGEIQYNGIIDCMRKTLRYEAPTAFFKGGLCRMMVIAPLFGIVQMVYFFSVAENLFGI